jgi:hypothetical protein
VQQPVHQPGSESAVPAGEATGLAREYQGCAICSCGGFAAWGTLEPYAVVGINVPIKLGHPTHEFDVALRGPDGWASATDGRTACLRGQLAEFVHWVGELRRIASTEVAAFFFASVDPQLGLLQTA